MFAGIFDLQDKAHGMAWHGRRVLDRDAPETKQPSLAQGAWSLQLSPRAVQAAAAAPAWLGCTAACLDGTRARGAADHNEEGGGGDTPVNVLLSLLSTDVLVQSRGGRGACKASSLTELAASGDRSPIVRLRERVPLQSTRSPRRGEHCALTRGKARRCASAAASPLGVAVSTACMDSAGMAPCLIAA